MKIKILYKLFALMVFFVVLQSRSTGPAGTASLQVAGDPGNETCARNGCHVSGAFSPTMSIQLLDGTDAVTQYVPGRAYTLQVKITAGTGTPARYGFQAVALNGDDNQAGAWTNVPTGYQAVTLSNRDYVEHSTPHSDNTFEVEWTAPAQGAGDVTFYSAGIASNNNGGTSGDGMANNTLTVQEDMTSNVSARRDDKVATLSIAPNPVFETLQLHINSTVGGDFNIRIMDATGKVAVLAPISVLSGGQVTNIAAGHLPPGLYIVQLCGENHLAAVQMLKR